MLGTGLDLAVATEGLGSEHVRRSSFLIFVGFRVFTSCSPGGALEHTVAYKCLQMQSPRHCERPTEV